MNREQKLAQQTRLAELSPNALVTYYPASDEYRVHVWGKMITRFHPTRETAITDAIRILGEKQRGGDVRQ